MRYKINDLLDAIGNDKEESLRILNILMDELSVQLFSHHLEARITHEDDSDYIEVVPVIMGERQEEFARWIERFQIEKEKDDGSND